MFNSVYNPQAIIDRYNNQIAELEKMKSQVPMIPMPNQPSINQTFQLSSNNGLRYANSIEEVEKENVITDTAFFSKDMSVLWVKNVSGGTKAYELKEIIKKDEKDLKIEFLMAKISELEKGMMENAKSTNANDDEPTKNEKPTSISDVRANKKK